MTRKGILSTLAVLALCASFAYGEDTKPAALAVSLSAAKPQVALGENITVEVKVENTGDAPLSVRELLFDRSSLSFDIKWGERAFQYAIIRPNVYECERVKLATATLPGKKAMIGYFDLPAARVGKWNIVASYAGAAGEPVKSAGVDVEVTAADGKDHLVAVVDVSREGSEKGKVVFHFFADDAPNTVMNFVRLAKAGFYTNLTFHRVIKDFMIQGGCPFNNGQGGPGYSIKAEFSEKRKHEEGTVAMARSSNLDSAGSQFYICLKPQPKLDGAYTVFGQVEEGMDFVRAIGDVPTTGPSGKPTPDRPMTNVTITSVTIEARGAAAPGPGDGKKPGDGKAPEAGKPAEPPKEPPKEAPKDPQPPK